MKRLLVLSGKGGTGKTTVSAALIHLAQAQAVADCDVDAPNLHLVLRPTTQPQISPFFGGDKATVDASSCIGCKKCQEHCRFDAICVTDGVAKVNPFSCEGCGVCQLVCPAQAVTLHPDQAGSRELYEGGALFSTATLKMGRGNSGKLVSEVKLALLNDAPPCDLAIFDGSPGIGCPVMASISGMHQVLVVAEPTQSGISDLKRLVQTMTSFQVAVAVCVNKYDTSPQSTAEIEAFCQQMDIPLVGRIPFDPQAVLAVNGGYTVVEIDCPAGRAIRNMYHEILQLDEGKRSNHYENRSIL